MAEQPKTPAFGVGSLVHLVDTVGACVEVVVAEAGSEEGRFSLTVEPGLDALDVPYAHAKAIGTWHHPSLDD